MTNRQSDKKPTKQVRIEAGLHKLLKMRAAESGMSVRGFLEDAVAELLAVENIENNKQKNRNTE